MGSKNDIKNKEELFKKESFKWEKRVLLSSILIFIIIIALFILQLGQSNWEIGQLDLNLSFYLRSLITSPIIFYLFFSVKQYDKNRKLYNEYVDKSTLFSIFKEINN